MKRTTAALFFIAVLLAGLTASAGTAQFRDEAQILPQTARDQIAASARQWPFDLKVLSSTATSDRGLFERRVSAAVTSPDVVAVGIDPAHRFTVVRVGMGLSLERNNFSQIVAAGNDSFRGARWADGIISIGDTAKRKVELVRYLRDTAKAASRPDRPKVVMVSAPASNYQPSHDQSGSTIGWLLGGFIATLIVVCAVGMIIGRRREKLAKKATEEALIERETERIFAADRARESRRIAELTAAPVAPMPDRYESAARHTPSSSYVRPAYSAPARVQEVRYIQPTPQPSTVVVHDRGSGSDGLLTGMLLGEAMHSHHRDHSDRHVVERVIESEPARSSYDGGGGSSSWGGSPEPETFAPAPEPAAASYDGGGGSSSWDGGSSSSSDSSSSSFDGGSSPSCDSGGGSSDF